MLLVGAPHLVVADDVVAAALVHRDGVRTGGVTRIPAIGAVARLVYRIALDHDAVDLRHAVIAARGDAGILAHPELPAGAVGGGVAAPAADVVLLDDDVVAAWLHDDAVLLRAFHGEAAHDHVVGVDVDADRLRVRDVDHRAGVGLVKHVAARRSALRHVECGRLAADADCLRDGELLAPRCSRQRGGLRAGGELKFVRCAARKLHHATAAFAVAAVVPCGFAETAVLQRASSAARIDARRPIEADRLERSDGARRRRRSHWFFGMRRKTKCDRKRERQSGAAMNLHGLYPSQVRAREHTGGLDRTSHPVDERRRLAPRWKCRGQILNWRIATPQFKT